MDPRINIIDERLGGIGRIIAVTGGKGGIGKSMVSSTLALILADLGYRVGLFDLDFYGPSDHVILGISRLYPKEEKGIVPPEVHGIKFISIIYYAGDSPSPIRGSDVSNALIELLTITRWGALDFLVIDMPPGIGDATLDVIRLMKRNEFVIVTTQSKVAIETVKKMLQVLKELSVPILGVIENMRFRKRPFVEDRLKEFSVQVLGGIDFDQNLEDAVGDAKRLIKTRFAQSLREIVIGSSKFKAGERGHPS
ncbi:MAG: ATP-binding protein [Promethearchaeota archaeon]